MTASPIADPTSAQGRRRDFTSMSVAWVVCAHSRHRLRRTLAGRSVQFIQSPLELTWPLRNCEDTHEFAGGSRYGNVKDAVLKRC